MVAQISYFHLKNTKKYFDGYTFLKFSLYCIHSHEEFQQSMYCFGFEW